MNEIISWANTLYSEGVDKKDAAAFANAFTDAGWLRFGNNDPIVGRDNIREAIAGFFTLMESLSHESTGTTYSNGTLVLEANVTYTLHDERKITVPACTIFRMSEQGEAGGLLARKCQIYVDLAPLFAAVQSPGG